jgi:hypothetical protein
VAAESGKYSRSVIRPDENARELAGELLQRRRAVLGYGGRRLRAFARDRGVSDRLLRDVENPQPGRNYLKATVDDIARAYRVDFHSLVAVLRGEADALVPEEAAVPPGEEPPPPMTEPGRIAAARPYADEINERRVELGAADPPGDSLFPPGSRWSRLWDDLADMDVRDRVWFIADLQRRQDHRRGGGQSRAG